MKFISPLCKRMIVYGIIGVLLLNITGCGFREKKNAEELSTIEYKEEQEEPEEKENAQTQYFRVYVCGAVSTPGVYEMEESARVCDAIESAGGFREDAAKEYLNQARRIEDGERILVPTEEEASQMEPETTESTSSENGKININTATKEELENLNGIGESRAESIIQYREKNGRFSSIDELMNVDGIKDGVFEKIKDSIIV